MSSLTLLSNAARRYERWLEILQNCLQPLSAIPAASYVDLGIISGEAKRRVVHYEPPTRTNALPGDAPSNHPNVAEMCLQRNVGNDPTLMNIATYHKCT